MPSVLANFLAAQPRGSLICCFGLNACETTPENEVQWEIEGKCTTKNGCEVGGKISGSFGGDNSILRSISSESKLLTEAIMSSNGVPDAALFAINVGGTVEYPITGQVVIKLVDSSTSTVQAVDVFPWDRNGNVITLSDPDSVNSWALAEGGSADTLDYDLVPWTPPQQAPGIVSMSVQSEYEGNLTAFHFSDYCYTATGEYQDHNTCLLQ